MPEVEESSSETVNPELTTVVWLLLNVTSKSKPSASNASPCLYVVLLGLLLTSIFLIVTTSARFSIPYK